MLLLGQSARLRGSLSSLCLLPERPQAPAGTERSEDGPRPAGAPSAARLLALVIVSVPSPPLPGCHVHLRSCRAQSGTMAAGLIKNQTVQECGCRYQTRPRSCSLTGRRGPGGGGTRLCRVHGRDGRLAPTSAAPPRRARLVSCTATV